MRIINNNALDALKELPYESVDCIITSPPYYGLRSYKGADTIWGGNPECEHDFVRLPDKRVDMNGSERNRKGLNKYAEKIDGIERHSNRIYDIVNTNNNGFCQKCGAWKGQLGLEPTYQMYIEHLMMITRELKRVLKKTGTMFWNMGDSYAGNMGSRTGWQDSKYSETREQGIENGEAVFLKANYGNIPQKSLMMIPERFVIAMIDDGWILRNKIIWRKTNGMPSSVKDRFSNKWEYVFFFTKNKKYYFNLDAVRKPLKQSSINRIKQKNIPNQFKNGKSVDFGKEKPNMSIPRILNNMHQKYEQNSSYEGKHSGYFNEDGSLHANPKGANPGDVVESGEVSIFNDPEIVNEFYAYLEEKRPELLMPSLLSIATIPHKESHFAIYPETLVAPLIKAGCPKGGIVLDPFAGSGTTGVVAEIFGRDSVLIEISPEYCKIIEARFKPENIEKVVNTLVKKGHKDALLYKQKPLDEVIEE